MTARSSTARTHMTTGRPQNHFNRLRRLLVAVKYPEPLPTPADMEVISPQTLRRILDHTLTSYHPRVAEHVLLHSATPLSSLSLADDPSFFSALIAAVNRAFDYRPTLTPTQCANDGFVEHKLLFACELMDIAIAFAKPFQHRRSRSRSKSAERTSTGNHNGVTYEEREPEEDDDENTNIRSGAMHISFGSTHSHDQNTHNLARDVEPVTHIASSSYDDKSDGQDLSVLSTIHQQLHAIARRTAQINTNIALATNQTPLPATPKSSLNPTVKPSAIQTIVNITDKTERTSVLNDVRAQATSGASLSHTPSSSSSSVTSQLLADATSNLNKAFDMSAVAERLFAIEQRLTSLTERVTLIERHQSATQHKSPQTTTISMKDRTFTTATAPTTVAERTPYSNVTLSLSSAAAKGLHVLPSITATSPAASAAPSTSNDPMDTVRLIDSLTERLEATARMVAQTRRNANMETTTNTTRQTQAATQTTTQTVTTQPQSTSVG